MLIVGMVSAGIAYNHQLGLTHAAREGGRNAATLPVSNYGTLDDWLGAVINQVVEDATGTLADGVPGRYVCVAYVYPDGTEEDLPEDQTTRRILSGSTLQDAEDGLDCLSGDGRPESERRVQVEVRRDTNFNALVFSSTLNLDSEAINRYEPSSS